MTDRIGYQHGQITALTGDVLGSAGALRAQLDDLRSFLAPLVTEWTGEAAQQYGVHQRQWDTAAAELQRMLAAVADTAQRGNAAMQAADRRAAGAWG